MAIVVEERVRSGDGRDWSGAKGELRRRSAGVRVERCMRLGVCVCDVVYCGDGLVSIGLGCLVAMSLRLVVGSWWVLLIDLAIERKQGSTAMSAERSGIVRLRFPADLGDLGGLRAGADTGRESILRRARRRSTTAGFADLRREDGGLQCDEERAAGGRHGETRVRQCGEPRGDWGATDNQKRAGGRGGGGRREVERTTQSKRGKGSERGGGDCEPTPRGRATRGRGCTSATEAGGCGGGEEQQA